MQGEDEDVAAERARVAQARVGEYPVQTRGASKVYPSRTKGAPPKLAVNHVSMTARLALKRRLARR